jgi:hypothetical protein
LWVVFSITLIEKRQMLLIYRASTPPKKGTRIMIGILCLIGLLAGCVIAALGHPKIYRAFFGGSAKSLDH